MSWRYLPLTVCLVVAGPAHADSLATAFPALVLHDADDDDAAGPSLLRRADAPAARTRRHLLYAEALGKGGLYGLGYEYTFAPGLAVGAVGSYVVLRDQRLTTGAGYLHARLFGGRHHTAFAELGVVLARSVVPSPVERWDGLVDHGAGGVAGLGWERVGDRLVVRTQLEVLAGHGGVAPWLGLAIGVRP